MDAAGAVQGLAAHWIAESTPGYGECAAGARAWLLTVNTLFRRPVFDDTDAARAVARVHRQSNPWSASQCLAWVLLPDRWQALVAVAQGDSVERLVQRFKTTSARLVESRLRVNGWLWERGFEAQLLPEGGERDAARRLVIEPVRAGLAGAIGEYPYWDAIWLGRQAEPGPLRVAGAGAAA